MSWRLRRYLPSESMKALSDRRRRFAEFLVQGLAAGRAYEQAGFKARGNSAEVEAGKLAKNPDVAAYVAELRAKASESAGMTAEQMIADCVRILQSPPSAASMDNPLCEIRMSKVGPFAAFPSKIAVMERLAKMLGFDKPQKVELSAEEELRGALAGLSGPTLPNDRDQI